MSFLAGRSVQTGLYLTAGSTARSLVRSITSLRPHRWIGDPCGTIRYNGRYLAYSWGAAQSDDLLHWTEINDHAIKGLPKGTAAFTGSVVADRENSAGYGEDALIAVFTSFDEASKKQSQSIAFSHDGGLSYSFYDGNPVLDIWSTEFRDPTVIRDREHGRWIMLVAKALEKKVAFYGSTDLKHWEWLSDFGPMGDSQRSWECPDMFRLPVEGTDRRKWVMVISTALPMRAWSLRPTGLWNLIFSLISRRSRFLPTAAKECSRS